MTEHLRAAGPHGQFQLLTAGRAGPCVLLQFQVYGLVSRLPNCELRRSASRRPIAQCDETHGSTLRSTWNGCMFQLELFFAPMLAGMPRVASSHGEVL